MASRHIFLDWKAFVNGAMKQLVSNGESDDPAIPSNKKLYVEREADGKTWKVSEGIGTEHKGVDENGKPISANRKHRYVELYTDPELSTPLIDYSYCIDESGNVIHDRWDYWTVDDFR